MSDENHPPEKKPKSRLMLGFIAVLLFACAIFALVALKRLPLPIRAILAFGDVVTALALLLMLRKNPLRQR
jgi:hypothetical protein